MKQNLKTHLRGFSLVEILVTITLFVILSVIITSAIATTLKNATKAEAITRVKNNLESAFLVIQRQIYNARQTIDCGSSDSLITFLDKEGKQTSFQCLFDNTAQITRVASGSANIWLTSDEVAITSCSFTCTVGSGVPDSVDIQLTGQAKDFAGQEGYTVTKRTQMLLRNY